MIYFEYIINFINIFITIIKNDSIELLNNYGGFDNFNEIN